MAQAGETLRLQTCRFYRPDATHAFGVAPAQLARLERQAHTADQDNMAKRFLPLMLAILAGCSALKPAAPLSMDHGDLGYVHPIETPRPEVDQLGDQVPQEIKDRTWLFFINGLDPYYLANFRGQCQHLKLLGYNHAYCGQMSHSELFRTMIQQVRRDDSAARVVLIGYSFGANYARSLAHELKDDGVRIDLLVYLGGDTLKNADASRPANVERIVNINGHGSILLGYDLLVKGDNIQGASNHRLDARHFLLPTRPETAELLVRNIVALSQGMSPDGVAQASASGGR
jgi:pimeloyl-ACP methyl ester carboxylesterase